MEFLLFFMEWANSAALHFLKYSTPVVAHLQIIEENILWTFIANINQAIAPPERSVGQAFLGALIFKRANGAAPLPGVTTRTC